MNYDFLSIDLPPMLTATFAAIACGLLGNFLVLRRLSLMGDAISHAVLPGIVIAFLLTESRATFPVFLGAAAAGVLTALLIEAVQKLGKMESGAAMGVVFSVLFALGVLLIEQAAARSVDLDADCLLHGQLERVFWFPPQEISEFFSLNTLELLPREFLVTLSIATLTSLFVMLFYKELKLSAFDPALATSLGFNASALHYILMVFVAGAVVASFEAVGSILVIAMIICPAATARLITDQLRIQIWLSVLFATLTGVLGYLAAAFLPPLLGWPHAVNAAGMMTIIAGLLLGTAVIASPSYGVVARWYRRYILSSNIAREDLLGLLYRFEELSSPQKGFSATEVANAFASPLRTKQALRVALKNGEVTQEGGEIQLTKDGQEKAKQLIRAHRLWESYLVEKLGLRPDHVHDTAMELEHFTSSKLTEKLLEEQEYPEKDPHEKPIP